MAGPGVFHVEFGINETPLTQSLEKRRFRDAEKMVRENNNASYLDEGCYQRTPLFILLSGADQQAEGLAIGGTRNLYLSKVLIEHGASVNYRVPATYFGSEYMSPGQTALELVVDFFNEITKHECHLPSTDMNREWRLWDPIRYKVIGLDNQVVTQYEDIKQQLADMLCIMVSNGGDSNITDEFRMTPLHRTVVYSSDPTFLEILCEGGANVNAVDIRGNTPLAAVCDAFPLGIQNFLDERPEADPYTECSQVWEKEEFLEYLVALPNIKLDCQNKLGRTALFNCIAKGDTSSARLLLSRGADPTLRGQVSAGHKKTREISPLFASLCSLRVLQTHVERYMPYLPRSYQFMCHLVDAGFFTRSKVTSELHEYIDSDFEQFQHLKMFGTQLVHLMFGGTSSSLRQLCTRSIFQNCFIKNFRPNPVPFFPKILSNGFALEDLEQPQEYMTYLMDLLDSSVLENLIDMLGMPKDALVYFEIELLRQRLFSRFRQYQWFKYFDEEVDGVFGAASDSDEIVSDEDDSDLEYW